MEKIKLSWSILNAWSKNDRDMAIKMLSHQGTTNMYMEDGRRIHEIISSKKLVLLPPRFQNPKTGQWEDPSKGINTWTETHTKPIEIFEWLEMSMIVDYLDPVNGILVDWKSGSAKSTEHSKMQLYVYAYILKQIGIDIKVGVIAKVEETTESAITCTDYSVYKINEEKLEVGRDYIEGNASEIMDFLTELEKGSWEKEHQN